MQAEQLLQGMKPQQSEEENEEKCIRKMIT